LQSRTGAPGEYLRTGSLRQPALEDFPPSSGRISFFHIGAIIGGRAERVGRQVLFLIPLEQRPNCRRFSCGDAALQRIDAGIDLATKMLRLLPGG